MKKRFLSKISITLVIIMLFSTISNILVLADDNKQSPYPSFPNEDYTQKIIEEEMDNLLNLLGNSDRELTEKESRLLYFFWSRKLSGIFMAEKAKQDMIDLYDIKDTDLESLKIVENVKENTQEFYTNLIVKTFDSKTIAYLSNSGENNYLDYLIEIIITGDSSDINNEQSVEAEIKEHLENEFWDYIEDEFGDKIKEKLREILKDEIIGSIIEEYIEAGIITPEIIANESAMKEIMKEIAEQANIMNYFEILDYVDEIEQGANAITYFIFMIRDASAGRGVNIRHYSGFVENLSKGLTTIIAGNIVVWLTGSAGGLLGGFVGGFWGGYYSIALSIIFDMLPTIIEGAERWNQRIDDALIAAGFTKDTRAGMERERRIKKAQEEMDNASKAAPPRDPLVLDLKNNGFNVLSIKNGVYFDLDNNGYNEKTEWITGDDAFLALDLNSDGKINNGSELFGDYTIINSSEKLATNGFEALAQHDENEDQIIDSSDAVFDKLLLWRDDNSNGISETNELYSLKDFDIKSINLKYKIINKRYNDEILIGNLSDFTFENNENSQIGEYWFNVIKYDTSDDNINIDIPFDIAILPNIRSYGNVLSLHKAMTLDSSGELKKHLTDYMLSDDFVEKIKILEKLLYKLTGANDIEAGFRGSFDGQKLHVLEQIMGIQFIGQNGPNPNGTASQFLQSAYNEILNLYAFSLSTQTTLKFIYPTLELNENNNFKNIDVFMDNFDVFYNSYPYSKSIKLIDLGYLLYAIQSFNETSTIYDDFLEALNNNYSEKDWIITMMEIGKNRSIGNVFTASNNGNTVNGTDGNDILIGGTGNDILVGGAGDDTYIFEKGFGKDTIYEAGGNDVIIFGEGITREMLEARPVSGNDKNLVITLLNCADTITVYSYFYHSSYCIEKIRFADGSEVTIDELLLTMTGTNGNDTITAGIGNTTLIGLAGDDILTALSGENTLLGGAGNDSLNGGVGDDTLIGGTGNDILVGGAGNDTYIFEKGFGKDTIYEAGGNDVIIFGEGITREMLEARPVSGNEKNLVITLLNCADTITVYSYFYHSSYCIEKIRFADGSEVTIDELLLTMTGTNGNDTITAGIGNTTLIGLDGDDILKALSGENTLLGGAGNDSLNGGVGDDTLIGGTGNDILVGGAGNDTYIFEKGFGKDTIYEAGGNDVIIFGEGITREMLEARPVSGNDKNLVITLRNCADTITVNYYFYHSSYCIEKIRFADGSEVTIDELLLTMTGTDGNDTITAGIGNTTLIGLAGDDILTALSGENTLLGGAGNDSLNGGVGDDTLIGGTGNDSLNGGGAGDDTYIFEKGFGKDTIWDNGGNDVIIFGEGITREMLEGRSANSNGSTYLLITLRGFEDTITVYNYFTNSSYKIEKIRFSDGTEIKLESLL